MSDTRLKSDLVASRTRLPEVMWRMAVASMLARVPTSVLLSSLLLRRYWRTACSVVGFLVLWIVTGSAQGAAFVVVATASLLLTAYVMVVAAGAAITWQDVVKSLRWRRRLRRKWPLACKRAGLLGLESGTPPRLRKCRVTAGGGVEALVFLGAWGRTPDDLKASAHIFGEIIGCRAFEVFRTGPGVARIVARWDDPLSRKLTLKDLATPAPGRIALGVTDTGQPAAITATKSLLLVGETGSGKSSTLWALIASLVQQEIPTQLCVLDPAGGVELDALGDVLDPDGKGLLSVIRYAGKPGPESKAVIHQVRGMMFERLAWMKDQRIRFHTPSIEQPLIVLIVDELLLMPDQLKQGSASELGQILTIGRKAAVVVWGCSQKPQKEDIGAIRDQFAQRICHHVKTREMVEAALGPGAYDQGAHATNNLLPGQGYMYVEGLTGYRRFRSIHVSDHEIRMLAAGMRPPGMRPRTETVAAETVEVPVALYRWEGRPKGSAPDCPDRVLLYVGISDNPVARLGEHQMKGAGNPDHWTKRVTGLACELEWFPNRAAAEEAERIAIREERPEANIAHAGVLARR